MKLTLHVINELATDQSETDVNRLSPTYSYVEIHTKMSALCTFFVLLALATTAHCRNEMFLCLISVVGSSTNCTDTLAGAWAGGTEYGVNFVLLIKLCLCLCVTSFPFVIFPLT